MLCTQGGLLFVFNSAAASGSGAAFALPARRSFANVALRNYFNREQRRAIAKFAKHIPF
jgi:hypothetical protein